MSEAAGPLRVGVDATFVRPSGHAGGEVALLNLLQSLLALNDDTHYTVYVDARSEAAFPELPGATIVPVHLPRRLPAKAARFAWQNTLLKRAVRRHGLEVMLFPANLVPARFPIPTVLLTHDFSSLFYRERLTDVPLSFSKRVLDAERVSSCRRADVVLAISEFTADEVTRITGVPRRDIRVVPWGVRPFAVPDEQQARRVLHARGVTGPYLLSVGSVMPHKNLPRLIEAFAGKADAELAGVTLVLVGQAGGDDDGVRRAIERHGISARVSLPGFIPDAELPSFYRGALAFVMPSLYEGFGFPVLESALCETPVASSRAGSLPEVMGDAALYFDPWDVDDIGRALARVATDPDLRAELSRRGRARAAEFSWARSAASFSRAFRDAAALRAGAGAKQRPAASAPGAHPGRNT